MTPILQALTFFIIFNGGSYHYFERDLNENNHPQGFEIGYLNYSFGCVEYENSFDKFSRACNGMIRKKWHKFAPDLYRVGAVTGYKINPMPFLLPGYGFQYENFHLEIFVTHRTAIFLTKFEF